MPSQVYLKGSRHVGKQARIKFTTIQRAWFSPNRTYVQKFLPAVGSMLLYRAKANIEISQAFKFTAMQEGQLAT